MSGDTIKSDAWPDPGVRRYLAIALVALAVIGVMMLQRTSGLIAFIPVLAGLAGALSGFGPILLVFAVAVCLNVPGFTAATSRSPIADGLLCAAVLGYVTAHYRMQSLLVQAFPPDPRNRKESTGRQMFGLLPKRGRLKPPRRDSELVTTAEIGNALWSLPLWAILAQYVWTVLPNGPRNLDLPPALWRAVMLAWLFGLVLFVVFGLLGYSCACRMTPDEATILLQDTLWAETRREQRRLNRWLVWQRRRKERT